VVLRVVIAEDSMLLREGIRMLLAAEPDIDVVGAVEDLPGLLAAVEEHEPDVVVTDVRMPPTHSDEGIRGAVDLRARRPGIGVVVLSQYAEPAFASALIAGGSQGRAYLVKDRVSEPGQLTAAVRAVVAGGSVIDPLVVEALVADASAQRSSPLAALTPREREVLAEMAAGKSNAAIGAALFLTERAVEKHVSSLLMKLGVGLEPELNRRVSAVLLYLAAVGETAHQK
jgi:DNA-binding NarL/FixJ family response regulator